MSPLRRRLGGGSHCSRTECTLTPIAVKFWGAADGTKTQQSEADNSSSSSSSSSKISLTPYGRNLRGAGGRSDQCSVKAWLDNRVWSLEEITVTVRFRKILHIDDTVN